MAEPEQRKDLHIRLIEVSKRFGDLVVMDKVDMDITPRKTTAIIGPSGAGKSVLIKHIVGLIQPDSGQVMVGDIDMARATAKQMFAVRKRFGMLFQHGALFDSLSAGENIAFPLEYHTKMSDAERRERAEEVMEWVGLPGRYAQPTSSLSGGQRKRVALARAIVLEPEVVFFDEPNSGLDPLTSSTIDDLICDMKARLGITFIVITHDIVSAVSIADNIAMLWKGHLIEYGPTEQVISTENEIVREFLKRNVDLPPLQAEQK